MPRSLCNRGILWTGRDLNAQPTGYESATLTIELPVLIVASRTRVSATGNRSVQVHAFGTYPTNLVSSKSNFYELSLSGF